MKRTQTLIFVIGILLTAMLLLSSCEDANSSGGINYTLSDNNSFYSVTSLSENNSLTDIVIPETYKNLPVKEIGYSAFANNQKIVSITLPNSIERISNKAFYNCKNLKNIVISDSVKEIGNEAFCGCKGLTVLTIGNNVETIGENAFSMCSNLVSVTVGESVKNIEFYAFFGCYKLVEIKNLSNLRLIAGDDDKGLISRYALNIYNTTKGGSKLNITDDGFIFYKDGTKTYLLGLVNNIDESGNIYLLNDYNGNHYELYPYAFYCRDDLKSIDLGREITYIPEASFSSCYDLETVIMSDSITYIDKNAFNSCYDLKDIKIPSSVTKIGESAFKNCDDLIELTIPSSVSKTEKESFAECDSLEKVTINSKTIGESTFADCKKLSFVTVGNSVLNIETLSFAGCEYLTDIVLGTSLKSIENSAFAGCNNLSNAEFLDTNNWYVYNPHTYKDKYIPVEDYRNSLKMALHLSDDAVVCCWVKYDN